MHAYIAGLWPLLALLRGDFNRDGFSDLYVWSDDTHRFEIFAGGPTGFGAEPIFTSNPPS